MIKINDIQINCLISFSISTDNEKFYEETAVDGTLISEHRNWRDNITFMLAPKTQQEHDLIISEIRSSGGTVKICYPITTTITSTRTFVIDSMSYSIDRDKLGDYIFSVINCSAKEVNPRV